jgi:hypothetical protein
MVNRLSFSPVGGQHALDWQNFYEDQSVIALSFQPSGGAGFRLIYNLKDYLSDRAAN